MKKFLALAALVLGVVSCQTEPEGLDVNVGGAVDTVVTVNIPENETRANNSGIGVFENGVLDGDATMRYIFQVYYRAENGTVTKSTERQVKYTDGTSVSFPVRLIPGRDYQFVVWADVVTSEDDTDNHYNTENLDAVSVIESSWKAMDETRDAFTASYAADDYNGSQSINIDLYRPFAKLRVIATDYDELAKIGIKVEKAAVNYIEVHRSTFNAYDSKAVETDVAFIDKDHSTYEIATYANETGDEHTIFSDYFFAENDVVKFEITVYDQNNAEIVTRALTTDIYAKRNYLTTIKGDILTDGNNVNVDVKPGFGGENGKVDGETFANVDTAEEFLEAFNKGVENITLEGDINLNDLLAAGTLSTRAGEEPAFVVAAGKKLTIDLNGYTISETKTQTAAHSMITNKGTLTIVDSKGNGKIAYKDEGNGGEYVSNTIQNSGVLTIESGIIENNSVTNAGYPHPIDNSGKLVINGGTITCNANYSSMRIWCTTDDDTEVIINGGTFNGCIDLHNVNNKANKGTLTINGGTFNADGYTKSAVRLLGFGTDVDELFGYINGGTFNGEIKLRNYVGGEFNSQVFFITGGTFSVDPSEYVADGYYVNVVDGKYEVNDFILTADTAGLQAAMDAATDGTTIRLTAGVNYGVVYMGRPTKSNNTTMICDNDSLVTTDEVAFAAHLNDSAWHTTPKYITTLKNLTIVGAEGATIAGVVTTSGHAYGDNVHDYVLGVDKSGSAYYNTLHMENIKFSGVAFTGKIDINTSDAESTYNGVIFEECTFTTGGTASSNGAAIRYYNEANNGKVKNITVKDCTFNNCYQGMYVHHINGITITGNEFDTTGHNAIAIQGHDGAVDLKAVVIKNNTFNNINDRVIRLNNVGADSQIIIQRNTATNSGDDAGEVIKATSIATGVTTNVGYNNWNGGIVVNPELRDTVAEATTQAELTTALQNANIETIYLGTGKYVPSLYPGDIPTRKSLTIIGAGADKTQFAYTGSQEAGQFSLAGFDSITIRDCEVLKRENVKNWGMVVFGSSNNANGVYTFENCTFNGVGTQGIYINEQVSGATYNILNCTFNGDFGSEGVISIQNNANVNHIVNVLGCTFNVTSNKIYVHYAYNGWTLNTDLADSDVFYANK